MFSLFFLSYLSILCFEIPIWLQGFSVLVMGVRMASVGMKVMHDGNHGSYSKKTWVNKLMGLKPSLQG